MPATNTCLADIDVLILAGGLGTRLAGVMPGKPKVLAPMGDRVFLDVLLERLASFGARRVVLSLGHLAEKVQDHVRSYPRGMQMDAIVESSQLGTAGAIRFARQALKTETVLVMNGDSLVEADLCALVDAHRSSGAAATLLCTRVADAARFGTVDIANGHIQAFREKTGLAHPGTINAGIYAMNRKMLDTIDQMPGPSLERDVFQVLRPGTLAAYIGDFDFIDIGTPEDLARASIMRST